MLIRDIMVNQPVYVAPETSLDEVVQIMTDKGIGFLIVAEHEKAVGVLTEGDLVRMAVQGLDMSSAVASEHMHAPVFSVQEDANVFHAYDELVLRNMRHLVVENEQGALVGVVTMSSFIANLGVEHFSELQTISDILEPIEVTVSADMLVTEAIQLMSECRHAMIALDKGKPVGILTSRGIARLCRKPIAEWQDLRMNDVMREVVSIHRKAFVPEASILMKNNHTRHLVVVGDQGEFMGLVTISDVAHSMEGRYVEFMRSVMRDMEQDLLAVGSQNKALFERNPNAVFSLDTQGLITHVNPASILLTGFSSDELSSKALLDLYEEDCKAEGHNAFLGAVKGDAQSVHLRMNGFNRGTIHVFMSFVPILVEGEISGVYAVAFDISERVLAEIRLHKLSQALQQAGEPIAITDSYGVVEFANLRMHRLFDYEDGALIGTNLTSLEVCGGGESHYKGEVYSSIQDGVPYKGDFLHQTKHGKVLDLRLSCAPVHVPGAEKIDYFINIYEDMTLRREAEQITLQYQKLETIGTLAGGIAHDFNNYLGAVSGSIYMLKRESEHMPHMVERLNKLEKITERAASLVSQLMTFSRKEKLMKQVISYSNLIEETKELSQLLIPKHVTLQWHIGKHVYINGNASQLQQILLNLLKNASDAIQNVKQPLISVTLSTIEVDLDLFQRTGLKVGDRFSMLSVSDNGCGIEDSLKDSVFDPFFTTKGVGEGTGMGLAMIYGAVQSHHGQMEFTSKKAAGTEFRLYFPMVSLDEPKDIAELDNEHSPTILLVDDEPLMREVGAEVLESLGYQVVTCDNGEDAVNLFREYSDKFSLAVLDVMMPRQNGVETAINLRKSSPDLPILFATGYDKHAVSDEILSQPRTGLISKPWKVEVLQATMKSLLMPEPV